MSARPWRSFAICAALLVAAATTVDARDVRRHPPRKVQTGLATYYGPGLNGGRTASGEVFDQRELVAAHRTLPLGSVVRVTNLKNGRSVVLRIVDRGPFGRSHRKGCIIDVSRAAARRLQFVRSGVTPVRVQVLRLG